MSQRFEMEPLPGDINGDNIVDFADFLFAFGRALVEQLSQLIRPPEEALTLPIPDTLVMKCCVPATLRRDLATATAISEIEFKAFANVKKPHPVFLSANMLIIERLSSPRGFAMTVADEPEGDGLSSTRWDQCERKFDYNNSLELTEI